MKKILLELMESGVFVRTTRDENCFDVIFYENPDIVNVDVEVNKIKGKYPQLQEVCSLCGKTYGGREVLMLQFRYQRPEKQRRNRSHPGGGFCGAEGPAIAHRSSPQRRDPGGV